MTVAADQLRLFIERIERLNEEKQALADDVRDVFAEAKSNGYDTWAMREVIKLRKLETHVRQERESLLETYCEAIGLTPIETAIRTYAESTEKLAEKGIGVSMKVGDGPSIPLNSVARDRAAQAATT